MPSKLKNKNYVALPGRGPWLALALVAGLALRARAQDSSAPSTPLPVAAAPAPANPSAAPEASAAAPSGAPPAPAAPAAEPVEKERPTAVLGSIADTNLEKIFDEERVLKPTQGSKDVFLTKGSSALLDLQNIQGYSVKQMSFEVTQTGIISNGNMDPSGAYRVTAGQAPGTTQVLIFENKSMEAGKKERGELLKVYRVTVTTEDLLQLMQEIKALVGDVEGLDIRIVGSKVVLDGAVLVPRDMRRVLAVMSKFEGRPVINLAEVSPVTMKMLGEKMEEEIAGGKDRPRDIRVKVLNGRFFLEGSVDTEFQKGEAEKICQAYISDRYTMDAPNKGGGVLETPKFASLSECISMIRKRAGQPAEPDPILQVRVDFVTLSRNYLKLFDFKWAPGVTAGGSTQYTSDLGKLATTFTATIGSLFPTLDTAASHGYARVLKTVSLTVRDGVKAGSSGPPPAILNETLNVYAPVKDKDGNTTLQSIPVSTKVKFFAKSVSGTDKINLDVETQQAELKSSGQDGGPVQTYETYVNTSIIVSNGESAALGGLITERRNVDFVRDPSSNGKYDFNLFEFGRQHKIADDKTQFIVFVTPTKLRNPSEGTEALKRKFRLRK